MQVWYTAIMPDTHALVNDFLNKLKKRWVRVMWVFIRFWFTVFSFVSNVIYIYACLYGEAVKSRVQRPLRRWQQSFFVPWYHSKEFLTRIKLGLLFRPLMLLENSLFLQILWVSSFFHLTAIKRYRWLLCWYICYWSHIIFKTLYKLQNLLLVIL